MQNREYGLLGYPLSHSFSKRFFDKKFIDEAIPASFMNFEFPEAASIIEEVRERAALCGFTITIPHKQNIIPLLNRLDRAAEEIGAVNCVKIENNRELVGYNTDYIGFVNSIKPMLQPHHTKALVLGTGGASKAVVYGLKTLGVSSTLVSRRGSKQILSYEELSSDIMEEHSIIVNTTPLGTFPKIEGYPDIPYSKIGSKHLLYDLVYNPELTQFLDRGAKQGATIKNGMDMLELQALEAWSIWNRDNTL